MSHAITRRTIESGPVTLAIEESGPKDRPTIVLLHGYPDTQAVWHEVVRHLAGRFHVVSYDTRGAGGSSAPDDPVGYGLPFLVDDLLAVLEATAPGRRVHFVGHDWGSVQGWEFASNPRSASHLATFTSISGPSLDYLGAWIKSALSRPLSGQLPTLLEQAGRSWYVGALLVPGLAELAWPLFGAALWPSLLTRKEHVTPRQDFPGSTLASDAVRGAWLYRRNVLEHLREPRLRAVARVPVQLIVPLFDRFLSPRLYDAIDGWAPTLTRRTLECGHWVPRTHPAVLADWIAGFVEAHEASAHAPQAI